MRLRKIQPADNSALARLIKNVFEEHKAPQEGTVYTDPTTHHLYEFFQADKAVLWVAEEKGVVLGCCGIYPTVGLPDGCVELVKFYLQADARGRGIGTQLIKRNYASAIELGYTHMYIESLPQFKKAVQLYEKQGFKRLKDRLGQSGHSSCSIWMLKAL